MDKKIASDKPRPRLILLDVYETILDMSGIEKKVNSLMNSKRGYVLWFELFMQYSFVDNCTVQFHGFESIADATLRMTSQMLRSDISKDQINAVLEMMKYLPLKENVQEGLSDLHEQGLRIAALTNSPEQIVRTRMEKTGLISYFEKVLSAEHVRKYKPAMEVYRWASESLDTPCNEMLLVSAHGWDIAGAENAGLQTAYVQQSNQMLYPLAPNPDFSCKDLLRLSDQLKKL